MSKQENLLPAAGTISLDKLSAKAIDFTKNYGACSAGITTIETLTGGPPSTDLTYALENAESAVTLAVALDEDKILDFLSKRDREAHQRDYSMASTIATGIAGQLASFICQFGHDAVAIVSNEVYRNDYPGQSRQQHPDISHRYLAVRGGIGWFGFSGNVLTPDYGPNVQFATVVTSAKLNPTEPLKAEDNYCTDCQSCQVSCPSGLFRRGLHEKEIVTMGGEEFSYSKRRSYNHCNYVCGGKTGLHQSGRWSTWSPARFPIPKEDEDIKTVYVEGIKAWARRPKMPGGALQQPQLFGSIGRDLSLTCGNCALVCDPDPAERDRRLRLLKTSGVVIQHEDGSVEAVSPVDATAHIAAMPPERRELYEAKNPDVYDPRKYSGHKNHSQYRKG